MSKNHKDLRQKLEIIFNNGGKSKHRHKAINNIGDMIFHNSDICKRSGIIVHLYSLLIEMTQRQATNYAYDQTMKIFRHLAVRSLENNDLTMLTSSFIPVSEFAVAKRRVLELAAAVYLKEAGSSYSQSKKFCQILFGKIQKLVIKCAPMKIEDAPDSVIEFWRFIMHLFTQTAVAPCEDQYPQKQWLLNLIKGYDQNDLKVLDWLKGYLEFICAENRNITIYTPNNSPGIIEFDLKNPHLVVPSELQASIMRLINEIQKERIATGESAREFKLWYYANRARIKDTFKLKCQEIIENYNFPLFSDGIDRVEVKLSALFNVGIRSFAFYPDESMQFPNVKLLVRTSKDMCIICDFWGSLENFAINGGDYIFENFTETDYNYLREVMAYVVVDAMHAIVVGNTDPGESKTSRPSATVKDGKHIVRLMRPRRRNLPEGHQASDEARMLAVKYKMPLPAIGKTFVRQHERPYLVGSDADYQSGIVNTITYSDDTLMRGIQKSNGG
ncbi:MAG: hypothetical protein Q8P20_09805 [bacterium]|nr:hypothetical protein [bacterium]